MAQEYDFSSLIPATMTIFSGSICLEVNGKGYSEFE